jgi:hypothetical protein
MNDHTQHPFKNMIVITWLIDKENYKTLLRRLFLFSTLILIINAKNIYVRHSKSSMSHLKLSNLSKFSVITQTSIIQFKIYIYSIILEKLKNNAPCLHMVGYFSILSYSPNFFLSWYPNFFLLWYPNSFYYDILFICEYIILLIN